MQLPNFFRGHLKLDSEPGVLELRLLSLHVWDEVCWAGSCCFSKERQISGAVLWAERVGKGKGRGKLGKTNICFGLCSGTQKRSVKHGADEDPLAYATFWAGLKSKFYHKNCKRGWYQLV